MPTPTYTPLANITLGSSAGSVTFSSISQLYRDLVLIVETTAGTALTVNGDTGSNYSYVMMAGNGSVTKSYTESAQASIYGGWYTNAGLSIFNIFDYSATDKHKSILRSITKADTSTERIAARWASTSAITSLTITGSMLTGSTLALYGIAA